MVTFRPKCDDVRCLVLRVRDGHISSEMRRSPLSVRPLGRPMPATISWIFDVTIPATIPPLARFPARATISLVSSPLLPRRREEGGEGLPPPARRPPLLPPPLCSVCDSDRGNLLRPLPSGPSESHENSRWGGPCGATTSVRETAPQQPCHIAPTLTEGNRNFQKPSCQSQREHRCLIPVALLFC